MAFVNNNAEQLCEMNRTVRVAKIVLLLFLFGSLLTCQNFRSDTLFQSQSKNAIKYGEYEVQKGDSLYSIAWRFKRDYKELARLNGIAPPYVIHVGQKIQLATVKDEIPSKSGFTGQSIVSQSTPTPSASPNKQSSKSWFSKKKKKTPYNASSSNIKWAWPANGKIVQTFSSSSVGKKGIQIAGNTGDPIKASASGSVVYSGNSLVGYGNLVIIKHSEVYLTAYAHNRRVLVKEGDQVSQGQTIAEMGSSGTDQSKLHFEIRKEGKPVNPLWYLPKKP